MRKEKVYIVNVNETFDCVYVVGAKNEAEALEKALPRIPITVTSVHEFDSLDEAKKEVPWNEDGTYVFEI